MREATEKETNRRIIKEYKTDLKKLGLMLAMITDEEDEVDQTPICIRISLGDDNHLDHWIENTKNIRLAIKAEMKDISSLLKNLKNG